jgi:uncharacterized RDD family membrane protein YckC
MGVDANNRVGFWKRTFSLIIDLLIINLVIIYPFKNSLVKYFGSMTIASSIAAADQTMPMSIYWILFIISLLALLYFTFFEYFLGASPGQMLLRIKVVSIDAIKSKNSKNSGSSESISFWRALLRNCFILPFFPFYVFWIIEPIYLAFYRERFLERITQTQTVHEFANASMKEYKLSKV